MKIDVPLFCKQCLLYRHTSSQQVEPRPYGRTLTATKKNQVFHMDFLFVGESYTGQLYILVIKDGLTGYVELIPCVHADAETTVIGVMDWIKRFGAFQWLVSDNGSHFKNYLVQKLSHMFGFLHHFCVAYTPWTNGTVERVNRDIIILFRSILLLLNYAETYWPIVLPVVQYAINNTILTSKANYSPATLQLGTKLDPAMATIFDQDTNQILKTPLPTSEIEKHYQTLSISLSEMHREVANAQSHRHDLNRRAQQKCSHANFSVGD